MWVGDRMSSLIALRLNNTTPYMHGVTPARWCGNSGYLSPRENIGWKNSGLEDGTELITGKRERKLDSYQVKSLEARGHEAESRKIAYTDNW